MLIRYASQRRLGGRLGVPNVRDTRFRGSTGLLLLLVGLVRFLVILDLDRGIIDG